MKRSLLLIGLILLVVTSMVNAAYVRNHPYQVTQPDGTTIQCFVSGDEYFNWLHDEAGFTIIQAEDGYYYYGVRNKDLVSASPFRVNTVNPASVGLEPWAKISRAEYQRRKDYMNKESGESNRAPHLGTMNNLVVYIKFSDDTEFTTTRQVYDDLFNLPTGNSLKSYYTEVSYNQFTIGSTHYPTCAMTTNYSYTDTHTRSYFEPYNATTNPNGYNGETQRRLREHALLRDAITWINANSPVPTGLDIDGDDDNYVDNVCFIIRGGNGAWASLLWAHRWVLYSYNVYINGKQVWDYTFQPESQVDVTTLCHEMFHALGAPDLYHYDDGGLNISPVSAWDLMESGSGHMGAYMKWKYSDNTWVTSIPEITSSGTYTLNPLTSSTNNCYKIASPNSSSEYFVVEYRKTGGTFESSLPGSGLIVYRIDPSLDGNADGPPDEVYIYRPNGTTTVNGSPWSAYFSSASGRTAINDGTNPSSFLQNGSPGGLNIYNITAAGSTISFTVGMSTVANPASFTALPVGETEIDLQWVKNGSNNNVVLAFSTSSTFGIPQSGVSYTAGSSIPGGGTVIYAGGNTTFNHTQLSAATTYYYKLWSVDGTLTYSTGASTNATTGCGQLSLPYSQDFNAADFPACWSQQVEGTNATPNWTVSGTNNAGGTANEMVSGWQDHNPATNRLVSPPINTLGVSELLLSFRHLLDNYGPGATLRVQSSSNGTTWTNEAWSLATSASGNVGPELVNTPIVSNLNSATTYLAFTIEGNLYQYDYWYVDDVVITAAGVQNYIVTTLSLPAEGGSTSGGGSVAAGTEITVTASPAVGYNFISWTQNGNVVSATPDYTFIVNGDVTLTANFELQQFVISATASPSEGGYTSGSGTYNYGETVSLSASPNTGYSFTNWTENGYVVSADAGYSFTAVSDRILVANFQPLQYSISVQASPSQGGTVNGGGNYAYGSQATVTATQAAGWSFINWTENGNVVSTAASFTFTVAGNRSLTANFSETTLNYTIAVSAEPSQAGTVTGGGIYTSGSTATLEALVNEGWEFINWTENGMVVFAGNVYSFTVTSDRILTANYIRQYTISTTVTPEPGGYTTGQGKYQQNSVVVLNAYANSGYIFQHWSESGNIVSTNPEYTFTANGDRNLLANFFLPVGVGGNAPRGFDIYPNPSSGRFIVESSSASAPSVASVSVVSLTGNELYATPAMDPVRKATLDLTHLPDGIYFLKIGSTDNEFTISRIVIRK
ncbi:MAG: M6 family metalloprotease domain-containing protein [Bacteroidales bacterium]|nr:M6 family metalloprotease domain-containing protein [Bacteroidales bacterium]